MATIGPLHKRSKQAHRNLARVFPDMHANARTDTVREMWRNAGRVGAEYPHLDGLLADPGRVTFEGLDDVQKALGSHKAALLLSAHYGNWEMTVAAGRFLGLTQANLYREAKNPHVEALMQSFRSKTVAGGWVSKGDGNLRDIMRLLRDGVSVGMLVDQRENRGVLAPFLGQQAWSVHAPALVARKMNVPIFVGVAQRTKGANFIVKCQHIPVRRSDDSAADVLATTCAINDQLSTWIREDPGQWLWFHNRWRDVPSTDTQRIHT